jgi:hypothetical protein
MFCLRSGGEGQQHLLVVLSLGNTEGGAQTTADTRDTNSLHIQLPAGWLMVAPVSVCFRTRQAPRSRQDRSRPT